MKKKAKHIINLLREFSIPLIVGVIVALIWANLSPESYHNVLHKNILGNFTFHFFVNDIFMVFFFAIATVEITQSLLPGGDLNPLKRAINPIMATLGGVIGPAVVYILLNHFLGSPAFSRGWGIPTATDIALAWLVARLVFGAYHPAVSFLLLLAIADDGIGLAIIAIFYPDPLNPVAPIWLLLTLAGMAVAFFFRRAKVKSYWPYIAFGGTLSWAGLHLTHLHPALALVFIIPFLPHPKKERAHLFEDDPKEHSTLRQFEHEWKLFVDFGLFMFGLSNAGVELSEIGAVTWFVFFALLIGKTAGIFTFGTIANLLGFPLPKGMKYKELFVAGLVAAMGLTVALFVAGVAFIDLKIQGAAKMGALFSAGAVVISYAAGKLLRIKRITTLK
ncbi:MAG: Na+/H+ antiporter NhaA [Desulfitobacteriaceae bacterium]|nr:Na+/H+ antiporter NhaA [Desulfitobacteriaceae bacterium]MDI6915094.1 Na+/H+ antiporter NhaA [Desulfitobacteriaceae bacterium]